MRDRGGGLGVDRTAALHLGLIAAGVRPGDEVITVGMTFVATVAAILYAGAKPVLVDVDPQTYTMDPAAFEAAITPRTRAVVPVHLHGRLADMAAICSIAGRHGITVIETRRRPTAPSGTAEGRRLRHGRLLQLLPGKNLGACGEGGAVTTDDPDIARTLRSLRDWGQEGRYNHVRPGFNYRLDHRAGGGAGGEAALPRRLDRGAAAGGGALRRAALPGRPQGAEARRARPRLPRLRRAGAGPRRGAGADAGGGRRHRHPLPKAVHHQPAYADRVRLGTPCPVSEALAGAWLSLPLFPEITERQIATVVSALTDSLGDGYAEAV